MPGGKNRKLKIFLRTFREIMRSLLNMGHSVSSKEEQNMSFWKIGGDRRLKHLSEIKQEQAV